MEQTSKNLFDLQIDHQSTSYLKEAAKWGKFLSVIGFIFCGLFVIVAIAAGSFLGSAFQGFEVSGGLITFIYIVIALIYFFPCLYLFYFSTKMQAALRNNEQDTLNASFSNLKSCFKFLGILMIIMLCFWALGIIIAIGVSMSGGF